MDSDAEEPEQEDNDLQVMPACQVMDQEGVMPEENYPVCEIQVLEDENDEEEKKSEESPMQFKNDSAEKRKVQRVLEDFGFGDVK